MSDRNRALILGPTGRVGVVIARSLRALGVHSVVGIIGEREPALPSNAIDEFIRFPADISSADFASKINDLAGYSIDMIMPCSDAALGAIIRYDGELRLKYRLTCPPADVLRRVLEKETTLDYARKCGIAIPKTIAIRDIEGLEAQRGEIRFPVIAKPATHEARRGFAVRYFATYESLFHSFEGDPGFGSRNVIQEFATGRGVGVGMLMHGGESLATFQHGRVKEMPASGGFSVVAESEPLDPQLTSASLLLLRALEWTGPAMVEFRRNDVDGTSVIMEVNGRYWGSIYAAILAGVDFPRYDWLLAHGSEPHIPSSYRTGIRMRWMAGDLDRLLCIFRRVPKDSLSHPSRLGELGRFLADFNPRTKSALWSIADPYPACADIVRFGAGLARNSVRQLVEKVAGTGFVERWHQVRSLDWSGQVQYARLRALRLFGVGPRLVFKGRRRGGSILFVCKGNIFRSAFSEAFLRQKIPLSTAHITDIASAGLAAVRGRGADPEAILAAAEMGVELNGHVAQPVTAELLARYDTVIIMDYLNAADMAARFGDFSEKVFLLGLPLGRPLDEVSDPQDTSIETVRACFAAIAARLDELFGSSPG